jgi:hypothetical protein
MNSRDYFVLGCKLLGVYLIFTSFPYVCSMIGTAFLESPLSRPGSSDAQISRIVAIGLFIQWLIILGQIGLGIYFLRCGKLIHDMAYPSSGQTNVGNMNDALILGFKILGMYLIISSIPEIIWSISTYAASSMFPGWLSMLQDRRFTVISLLPKFGGIALGLYLFKTENIFTRIACGPKISSGRESD